MTRHSATAALGLMLAAAWSGSHATPDQPLRFTGSATPIQRVEAEELTRSLRSRVQRAAAPGAPARIPMLHPAQQKKPLKIAPPTPPVAPSVTPASGRAAPAVKTSPNAPRQRDVPSKKSPAVAPKPAASTHAAPPVPSTGSTATMDFSKHLLNDAKQVGRQKDAKSIAKGTGKGARPTTGETTTTTTKGRLHAKPDDRARGEQKGRKTTPRGRQRHGGFGHGQEPGKALAPGRKHGR